TLSGQCPVVFLNQLAISRRGVGRPPHRRCSGPEGPEMLPYGQFCPLQLIDYKLFHTESLPRIARDTLLLKAPQRRNRIFQRLYRHPLFSQLITQLLGVLTPQPGLPGKLARVPATLCSPATGLALTTGITLTTPIARLTP